MFMAILVFLVAWFVIGETQGVQRRVCNRDHEFPCDNGQCIHKFQWCDGAYDCEDATDEYYCDGTPCPASYFRCNTGMCLPSVAACDYTEDCPDGSDEICEGNSESHTLEPELKYFETEVLAVPKPADNKIHRAVSLSSNYLLNEMRSGNFKDASIYRAAIALSFVDRLKLLSKEEMSVIKKQVNIQLSLDLMQNEKLTLSRLALCVNALHAVCENPRNFNGMDLVRMLRNRTDIALRNSFNNPFVLLTLCTVGEYRSDDVKAADNIYKNAGNRLGVKSLALMAILCSDSRNARFDATHYITDISRFRNIAMSNADVHTKTLYLQAANSAGISTNPDELLQQQLHNGSFGDLLATYQAIPALLSTSILELKCETFPVPQCVDDCTTFLASNAQNATYTISVTTGTEIKSHSMVIPNDGKKTFHDIMRIAARADPTFRFETDNTVAGKKVYSIAGIPNDPESGAFWTLFRGNANLDESSMIKEIRGLDTIRPSADEHFIFRLQQD